VNQRLRLPTRLALGAAGLLLVMAPVLAGSPAAHAAAAPGSGLGGFRLDSEASGLAMIYNDGSEVDATLPDAESDFATGTGHALAADFYPGPVGGNPGATIQQFLGADLPASIITPLSTLQDNYKAEAYSSGPTDSSFPTGGAPQALSDTAHADDASATAVGTLTDAGEKVSAQSTTQIAAASVTTTATSTVADISIAGVIHIGQVVSSATASSDGTTGKASATTTISGVTVAGQAVSVDATGVTVGSSHSPLNLSSVVSAALSSLGITFSVSPNDKVVSGPQASDHAPALSIYINAPDNGGNTVTITLGGAEAEAVASTAYVAPPVATTTPAPVVASGGTSSSGGSDLGGSPLSTPSGSGDSQAAFAPSVTNTTAPTTAHSFTPAAADFGGLKWGLVVLGLLVAGGAAFGMGKIPDDVLADKGGTSPCPLERSAP
jgi:hypothetical protein